MGCFSSKKKNIVTALDVKRYPNNSKNNEPIIETMPRNSNEYTQKTDDEYNENFKSCIKLKVNADTTENMFPVWIENTSKVKIYVRGKWSLLSGEEMVDYKGHINFNHKHRDLPIGALIGRIQGGDYFQVTNEMTLESTVSGPLYLFANNSRFSVDPRGFLSVYLENAQRMKIEYIEEKLGWQSNEIDTTQGHNYLTEEEKMQIILINKIRTNPKKFAEQYLIHLKGINNSFRETYNMLMNYTPVKALKPSKALFMAARDHAIDIGENGTTGHTSTDGTELRHRLNKYAIKPTYYGENCSYGSKDALSNIIQLIVDDDYPTKSRRLNILNETYDQVGISIKPHASYKFVTIQVFGSGIIDRKNIEI
jgi:uncharacterized protein YkwD